MIIKELLQNFNDLDWGEILSEYLVESVLDAAKKTISKKIEKVNKSKPENEQIELILDPKEIIQVLSYNYRKSINWATEVSFRDSATAKILTEIAIELDLHLSPKKLMVSKSSELQRYSLRETLNFNNGNIILLGQPGAGKTTTLKKVFLDSISSSDSYFSKFTFQILIRLKEEYPANKQEGISIDLYSVILSKLGIVLTIPESLKSGQKDLVKIFVTDLVSDLNILLLIDGYDEVSDAESRTDIIKDLNDISLSSSQPNFIITSRSGDYDFFISKSKAFEICPLTEEQIVEFSKKWLDDEEKSQLLLSQIQESPYWDTAIRPLTIAHLCALFEREGKIPETPKSIYKKILELLLDDWNNQRSIEKSSKYGNFDSLRKYEFLCNLAFLLSVEWEFSIFTRDHLNYAYIEICEEFTLPKNEIDQVVTEIESHNGLIIQTGQDSFEFAHKSIQEYMVADFLAKLPMIPNDTNMLLKLPNELAITIAISIKPSYYFFVLVQQRISKMITTLSFLNAFIFRLKLEKPNFDSSPSFALTIIYIYNEICRYNNNILEITQNKLDNSKINQRKTVHQSLKNVLMLTEENAYLESLKNLKQYYTFSNVELNNRSDICSIAKFGKTAILKLKSREKMKIMNNEFVIPDTLYAPKSKFKIK